MPALVVPHGPRTELRVELVLVRGTLMLDLRVWEQARTGGRMVPTKAGFLLKPGRISDLQDALSRLASPPDPER